MKSFHCLVAVTATALAALSCSPKSGCDKDSLPLIKSENFERVVDTKKTGLYTLRGGDLVMQVTNFGARVVSLYAPDRDSRYEDIVLGYDNVDKYIDNPGERFLGAVVGPYANRIAQGTYTIDGQVYEFPRNDHGQTLHGGLKGLDMLVWDVDSVCDSSIVFSIVHPDSLDGMPGNLKIVMTYTLTSDNEFRVYYQARTDKPTHVNISHHSFFNLKGEGNGTILDNVMVINASHTTPVDSFLIPTGEVADVSGTPFDFREPHLIGERIDDDNSQLANGKGYDHNWVLERRSDSDVEFAVSVYEPSSGRFLEVFTDQPALQFYSGNFFDGTSTGKYGKPLKWRESIALETQKYPDTPHHPDFPSTLLRPGQTYSHTCIYRFSTK